MTKLEKLKNRLSNLSNDLLEEYLKPLGVSNIRFSESLEREEYKGSTIKRSARFRGSYRKETENITSFPRTIYFMFEHNGERKGVPLATEDFVLNERDVFVKKDVVELGDGLIMSDVSIFGKRKPMMLPYTFIVNGHMIDTKKFIDNLVSILKRDLKT